MHSSKMRLCCRHYNTLRGQQLDLTLWVQFNLWSATLAASSETRLVCRWSRACGLSVTSGACHHGRHVSIEIHVVITWTVPTRPPRSTCHNRHHPQEHFLQTRLDRSSSCSPFEIIPSVYPSAQGRCDLIPPRPRVPLVPAGDGHANHVMHTMDDINAPAVVWNHCRVNRLPTQICAAGKMVERCWGCAGLALWDDVSHQFRSAQAAGGNSPQNSLNAIDERDSDLNTSFRDGVLQPLLCLLQCPATPYFAGTFTVDRARNEESANNHSCCQLPSRSLDSSTCNTASEPSGVASGQTHQNVHNLVSLLPSSIRRFGTVVPSRETFESHLVSSQLRFLSEVDPGQGF